MLRATKLAANARPFRYLCYPVIGLGFLLLDQPSALTGAVVLAGCGLWPLAVDFGQRRASAKTILNVHLAEAALASVLFAWASLPSSLLFAVGIILVASNALQGGIRQALLSGPLYHGGVGVGRLGFACRQRLRRARGHRLFRHLGARLLRLARPLGPPSGARHGRPAGADAGDERKAAPISAPHLGRPLGRSWPTPVGAPLAGGGLRRSGGLHAHGGALGGGGVDTGIGQLLERPSPT